MAIFFAIGSLFLLAAFTALPFILISPAGFNLHVGKCLVLLWSDGLLQEFVRKGENYDFNALYCCNSRILIHHFYQSWVPLVDRPCHYLGHNPILLRHASVEGR